VVPGGSWWFLEVPDGYGGGFSWFQVVLVVSGGSWWFPMALVFPGSPGDLWWFLVIPGGPGGSW
jgi:hypothetical protein